MVSGTEITLCDINKHNLQLEKRKLLHISGRSKRVALASFVLGFHGTPR
jgi:hypothetical protein